MAEPINAHNQLQHSFNPDEKVIAIKSHSMEAYERICNAVLRQIEQEPAQYKIERENDISETNTELADMKKQKDVANAELEQLRAKMDAVPAQLEARENEIQERIQNELSEKDIALAILKEERDTANAELSIFKVNMDDATTQLTEQETLAGRIGQSLADNNKKAKLLQEKITDNAELLTRLAETEGMEIHNSPESAKP